MNFGIIGFGLIGRQRADDMRRSPRCKLITAYDANGDLVKAASAEYGFAPAETVDSIVQRDDVEAVVVAVPHKLAPAIAIRALESGKHVICEKPMGRNVAEASSILAATVRSGRVFSPGLNYRFYDGIQRVREHLLSGEIGPVTHVRFVLGHGGRPGMEQEWKTDKEMAGGGALLDPGIHAIDLFRFLFGEIREGSVILQNAFWPLEVEDNAHLVLRTENDQVIAAHVTITEWKSLFRLEIYGNDGYMHLSGRSKSYGPQKLILGHRWAWKTGIKDVVEEFAEGENSFFGELDAFLDTCEGKSGSSLARPEDGYRAVEIVERLYEGGATLRSL